MGKRAWWLRAITILFVLPVLAVGSIGVAALDPNDFKPEIIEAVQAATGRTLTLNGPVRLGRSLWPTIEVSDVTLANLPGGSRPDIARAERIEAQLSLLALLWHRIEVVKLTLVGPNILFEQVSGKPNWVFSPPQQASDVPAGTPGTPFELRIRNVFVRNGMVTWRLPARTKVVGIRTLDLQHHTDGGPLRMDAVLVYSDNQPFQLQASAQPSPAGVFGPWNTQLTFRAFNTAALGKGTMDVAGKYDLQVEATAGAMEQLNALLPEMRLPAAHRVTLSTHLTNGPVPGDLPVVGTTQLHFEDADLGDRVTGLKLGATDVSLPAAGALATVASTGQWAGQLFTLGGTFRVPMHPDGREDVDLDLKAQAAAGKNKTVSGSLALKGRLSLTALRFGGLDAEATFRTPALAGVRPLLSRRLPALTDVQFDGRLSIPADAGSVGFHGAKLLAHEGDLAGDGTIGLGATVALDAKLRSNKLDLDAVLAAFGIDLAIPAAAASATGPMIPATPLPWEALRGPIIDVTGSIGEVTFRDQIWRKGELALRIKDGRVQIATLKLAFPGGAPGIAPLEMSPFDISVTADASADPVPVSLVAHAPSVPLALVAHYFGLPGKVSGTMRVDAELRAAGGSGHDVAASLDGTVSASTIGGRLSNAAFIKLTAASLDALGIQVPAEGETTLRCLGLVGSFTEGVGRFPTIALETTYLSLAGVGQVDLGQETVAFKLNPLARISGSSVSVPIVVEGPFRMIKGRLDASGLDKLGLLIEAWLGGDEPQACSDAGLVTSRSDGG